MQSDLLDRPYSLPTGGSWSGGGPWPSAESAFRVHCQCTTWMLSTAQLTELPLGHPHWPGDGNSQLCCGGSRLWPSTVAVDFGPARWPSVCGRDVRRPAACGRDVRPAAGGVRRCAAETSDGDKQAPPATSSVKPSASLDGKSRSSSDLSQHQLK